MMRAYGYSQVENMSEILVSQDLSNISYHDLQAEGLGYLDNKEG
jgi:hypothetical protein